MKFPVTWLPRALDALAELWNVALDQAEMTRTADILDRILSKDPQTKGEELGKGLRALVLPPLAVFFSISE